jgi:hypothetical protein
MSPDFYANLSAEIYNGPLSSECFEYVHDNIMPKIDAQAALAKDTAIAEILSRDRKKIVSTKVGDGAISLALGMPDGPVFLYNLRRIANTVLHPEAIMEEVIPVAIAQQVVASLSKGEFDVGDPSVRAGIDMFVDVLLTAEQASLIKALAEVPDVITHQQVGKAIRGPWEV